MDAIICFSENSYHRASQERKGCFFLVFPRLNHIQESELCTYVPIEPTDDKKLAEKYTNNGFKLENDIVNASLNSSYYYCVSTMISICDYISSRLRKLSPNTVYLYDKPINKYIPNSYTGWGESSKNILTSPNCFYYYVSEKLSTEFTIIHHNNSYITSLVDYFSQKSRFIIVPFLCFILSLRKLRIYPHKKKHTSNSTNATKYFIIRTRHQFNIAKNIISSLGLIHEDIVIIELESLGHNGLQTILKRSGYKTVSPHHGFSGVSNSIYSLFLSYVNIIKWKMNKPSKEVLYHKGISFSLNDVAMDSFIQPQAFLYEKQLNVFKKYIHNKNITAFSFEQISPQAYFDHKVLDDITDLYFIKSTLIQEISMPCISWGKRFLVNNISELHLKKYSVLNTSSIMYLGSPKYSSILNLKKQFSTRLEKVLFATQPHEISINQTIIDELIKLSNFMKFTIVVRKHPRDTGKYIVKDNSNLIFDNHSDIYLQLASADLLIARTSTVLEECIYIGLPYISCLISAKDRSYSASYINNDSGLVVEDFDQLNYKIKNYIEVFYQFISWRDKYLKDFKCFSLS